MLKFNGVSTQFEAVKINTEIQQENSRKLSPEFDLQLSPSDIRYILP